MVLDSALIALVGGILCLDRVILQTMISRPVVAAPLVGLILGDLKTGLFIGAIYELLWLDKFPMGNYVPPNDSLAAVVNTAAIPLAAGTSPAPATSLIALSFLLFLPLGYVTRWMETTIVRSNDRLCEAALSKAEAGDASGVEKIHLRALFKYTAAYPLFIFGAVTAGVPILAGLYAALDPPWIRCLDKVYFALPLVACSVLLYTLRVPKALFLFSLVFFAALFIIGVLHG